MVISIPGSSFLMALVVSLASVLFSTCPPSASTFTNVASAATGLEGMLSGGFQLAHRLSEFAHSSAELKLITVVDTVAFAAATVLGGLTLMYLISFNTLVYVIYQQTGAKIPSLTLGDQVESNLVNSLLMCVQAVEDLDSMLIELIHLYPMAKHVGWMAAALGENPEQAPNKVARFFYIADMISTLLQLTMAIVMSVESIKSAVSTLSSTLSSAESTGASTTTTSTSGTQPPPPR